MADKDDLYEILGSSKDADLGTLKKAYRRLARQNHPDLNPGDAAAEERFKKISLAWEVLGDADRRRDYDEFGEVSLESGFDADQARKAREAFGARFGTSGDAASGRDFEFGNVDDLLGQMFGRGADGRGFQRRGADLETRLDLAFEEAVLGGAKRLTLSRSAPGGGATPENLTVQIPAGTEDGARLRLAGKGGEGVGGGPAGNLYVTLRVRPHRTFRRDGRDLEFTLPISVREAIEGAKVEVPTLDGRVTLTVPPGTDGGTRLRLRGKGVASAGGAQPGDLYARIQIRVPRGLDEAATASLAALEAFEDPAIRKELF